MVADVPSPCVFRERLPDVTKVLRIRMKIVLREFAKGIAVTLVFFVIVECLIRVAYFIRNSMVDYIPLPYGMASDYGPRPPWLENRRLLRPDKTLLWRGQPNLKERYPA
jgi:hypothetical protein